MWRSGFTLGRTQIELAMSKLGRRLGAGYYCWHRPAVIGAADPIRGQHWNVHKIPTLLMIWPERAGDRKNWGLKLPRPNSEPCTADTWGRKITGIMVRVIRFQSSVNLGENIVDTPTGLGHTWIHGSSET